LFFIKLEGYFWFNIFVKNKIPQLESNFIYWNWLVMVWKWDFFSEFV